MTSGVLWPENKRFAFTVFDDTDLATLENVAPVYEFLADCGFRTTKSCWPVRGDPNQGSFAGQTCEDAPYLDWLLRLQAAGFEIGWHGCTWHSSLREATRDALEKFAHCFGHYPYTGANHCTVAESIYWGAARLSGKYAFLYDVVTGLRNRGRFRGQIPGDKHFWGDFCRERIKYFRNFVYQDINTLRACPFMPYYDSRRPFVNNWFASSNGSKSETFLRCLSERNQDRLEAEGGACIMYTHFAKGFFEDGHLRPRFVELMKRLAAKPGWFVPTHALLDHLRTAHGGTGEIAAAQRRLLERKWFLEKLRVGSA